MYTCRNVIYASVSTTLQSAWCLVVSVVYSSPYSLCTGPGTPLVRQYTRGNEFLARRLCVFSRRDDSQESTRAGATLALPVNRYNSVKLYASTGVATRTGGDFDTIGAAWQVRWGGGL